MTGRRGHAFGGTRETAGKTGEALVATRKCLNDGFGSKGKQPDAIGFPMSHMTRLHPPDPRDILPPV